MPDGLASYRDGRHLEVADIPERLRVPRSDGTALLVPAVEQCELSQQNDRLNRVEARGPPFALVSVFRGLAVFAEGAENRGEVFVARDDRSGVAHRPEVLRGIEAERCGESPSACAASVAPCAVRLRGILDDGQVAARGNVG